MDASAAELMRAFAETSISFVIVEVYYRGGLSDQIVWALACFVAQTEVHGSKDMGDRT
jgi:hypothetical protein